MEKEKRKINLVGQNTLTISLPTKYVKINNLGKGDELYTSYNKDEITFSLVQKKRKKKEVEFNIDNFSYYSLSRYLSMLYMKNYNKITLKHTKNVILYNKTGKEVNLNLIIKKIVNRLLGAEIVSSTSKETIIECFITHDTQDLEKIEKRIYFLLKDLTTEMLNSIGEKFEIFHESVYEYHDNIDKFIYYFLRELDFSDKDEEEKKVAYSFYIFITTIVDEIRHISEKINKNGCSDKLKKYLEEIFEMFFEYFMEFIFKANIVQSLVKKRYNLVHKIDKEKFNLEELETLMQTEVFLDSINRFSEYSIIKALTKGLISHKE